MKPTDGVKMANWQPWIETDMASKLFSDHRANNCDHVPMGCRKFLTDRNPQLCNGGQTIAVGEREKSSAATSSLIAPPQPLAGKIYCSAGDANLASAPHDGASFFSLDESHEWQR
ncbi:hypothetical protein TIFTF001_056480 [Ficus carica]|uniref:Uncharacterized protein n=1 Tax=Ficus carica TaxID=3494 RepID=A0AA88EJB9_FICCA|nr:hypothetical protein TIFTF001_056477 [Ficus carica]GMN75754.1 hypothetical protein TIFTF001_056478 [Ficus carica]GMN75756.1 hypothetical protein TIFTF001_056479 [Ficus carica]GMN75758.1 hypothetical protein TIFTF001_056480 [Ficus carica]